MKRPIIVVTPDITVRQSYGVDQRIYELNAAYTDAVVAAGGLPVVAPYQEDPVALRELMDAADGLLLTGGDFDVDPRMFGARPHPKLGTLKPSRTQFEKELFLLARERDLPTLGVCGGMQLMNVLMGGTLWQDLPDERPTAVAHSQKYDRRRPGHSVTLTPGTRMHGIYEQDVIKVNTSHHQAVRDLAPGLVGSGISEDGLVEALEIPRLRFALGVQWHPETLAPTDEDPRPRAVYQAFIRAAAERGRR
ncbi:MAG: gamma-glutamyl-gamma-aminobutyrate hydrolase family protein [Myxococcota bacterium]